MNITLSADKKLIEKSRDYAKNHNTTLNNLIREYLMILVHEDAESNANEFEQLAYNHSGKSKNDYKFSREEIYDRKL